MYDESNSKFYFIFDLYAPSKDPFYKVAVEIMATYDRKHKLFHHWDAQDEDIHELGYSDDQEYQFETGHSCPDNIGKIRDLINHYILPYDETQKTNLGYVSLIQSQISIISPYIYRFHSGVKYIKVSCDRFIDNDQYDCFRMSIKAQLVHRYQSC
jgi:hypothetical protein